MAPHPAPGDFDPQLYDQYCFACGRQNPIGLQLRFARVDDGVRAHYRPRAEDAGFPGVLHGGVLVTLLDEAMAWAMYSEAYALGVTAKMDIRYRRPAQLDDTLVLTGRVTRVRGRRIEVAATIDSAAGERLVEAAALFLRVPPDREAELMRAIGWDVGGR
jgi:uncharacterized protein (TIGR00369 family)